MKKVLWFIPMCTLFAQPLLAQGDFSQVQVEATHVAGKVHMLQGAGGNIGALVGDDGILLVDDQFAPLSDKIRGTLAELEGGPVRFVLNTHWHQDHTGGNENFGKTATIIAHTNVRKRLSTEQFMEFFNRKVMPQKKQGLPVITFDESVSIHFNDEEVRVVHYPTGHTDGDSIVFFDGSKVVHMGDTYFKERFPFVDLGSGGNVQGLIENVGAVLQELDPDHMIIPGHGDLSTVAELAEYHDMLVRSTAIVDKLKQAGRLLEEIQQEAPLASWAEWGEGFISTEQWIETIYKS